MCGITKKGTNQMADKLREKGKDKNEETSYRGTFFLVLLLGALVTISWFSSFYLFLSRF
jgi:hypothetical protein